jgi:hypothetical protein
MERDPVAIHCQPHLYDWAFMIRLAISALAKLILIVDLKIEVSHIIIYSLCVAGAIAGAYLLVDMALDIVH